MYSLAFPEWNLPFFSPSMCKRLRNSSCVITELFFWCQSEMTDNPQTSADACESHTQLIAAMTCACTSKRRLPEGCWDVCFGEGGWKTDRVERDTSKSAQREKAKNELFYLTQPPPLLFSKRLIRFHCTLLLKALSFGTKLYVSEHR